MATRRVQNPLVCHGHSRPIVEVTYSAVTPDGYFLASASKDGQPMLRMGETGDWIGTFMGHKGAVWSCQLNKPALLAATGSADFTARVWDALTGDELHQFAHKHIVRSVCFASGSNKLATGGMEKILRIYDVEQPKSEPMTFPEQADGLRCTVWSHNDNLLITSLLDVPGLNVWDVRTGKLARELATEAPVSSIEIVADGSGRPDMITAEGRTVAIWDSEKLQMVQQFRMDYGVESASLSVEKQRFISGGNDMWVRLYALNSGEELEVNRGHHGPVRNVRFAPGGELYASGSEDGTIRIWRTDFLSEVADADEAVRAE